MRLVVVRETANAQQTVQREGLEYAFSTEPLQAAVLRATRHLASGVEGKEAIADMIGSPASPNLLWLVPQAWRERMSAFAGQVVGYTNQISVGDASRQQACRYPWLAVSDGRFATHLNGELLRRMLDDGDADVVAVNAAPDLLAYRERMRLTPQGDLVGYRRLYRDAVQPIPLPADWPHHLFIRSEHVAAVLGDEGLRDFADVIARCRAHHLKVRAAVVAGFVADLDAPTGWLTLVGDHLNETRETTAFVHEGNNGQIAADARIVGPVLLGDDVCIESGAVLVGPSILCRGSVVRKGAVVDSSIVGASVVVEPEQVLKHVFVARPDGFSASLGPSSISATVGPAETSGPRGSDVFRQWPRLSYARCFKRLVDIAVALMVLLLFIPIIPVIALAIKVNSPGPIFFRDKRQGFHGRLFDCIKFRTMRVGAADIQDKLRFVCEVDGPQFKMADDPRISTVGRFLRETYLDEIPQFFNVLCGDMSVVGPRPSPESENTLCPWWRDARLSVRPGITGLWQVKRTRQPFQDFQEWICYDTQYVCQLSPRMDLWICWRTFMNMMRNFVHQF